MWNLFSLDHLGSFLLLLSLLSYSAECVLVFFSGFHYVLYLHQVSFKSRSFNYWPSSYRPAPFTHTLLEY